MGQTSAHLGGALPAPSPAAELPAPAAAKSGPRGFESESGRVGPEAGGGAGPICSSRTTGQRGAIKEGKEGRKEGVRVEVSGGEVDTTKKQRTGSVLKGRGVGRGEGLTGSLKT